MFVGVLSLFYLAADRFTVAGWCLVWLVFAGFRALPGDLGCGGCLYCWLGVPVCVASALLFG